MKVLWSFLLALATLSGEARQPWVKKGRILAPGFAGTRSNNLLSAPCVVKLKDGRLRLYFWGRNGVGQAQTEVGRMLSNAIYAAEASPANPREWKLVKPDPMLGAIPSTPMNDRGPSYPWVVQQDDGPWLMYYTTWGSWAAPGQISNRTAVAISHDQGLTWTVRREPIFELGAAGQWDSALTGSAAILRTGSHKYEMWYTGGEYGPFEDGTRGLIAQIGHATSRDGIEWTKNKSNPVLAARRTAIPQFEAVVSKPTILRLNGVYHMWYSRRVNDGRNYRLAYARSKDGLRWERVIDDHVLEYSSDGFDAKNMSYPNVIEVGDELWMFYVGDQFGSTGIGLATMKRSELR